MWSTLDDAVLALTRDGWTRETAYWWHKAGQLLEVEKREDGTYWPVQHTDEELNAD